VFDHVGFFLRRTNMLLENLMMEPGGLIAWLVVGLIAGRLAGKVMQTPGHGVIGDLLLGLIGAVAGGALPSLFSSNPGFWVGVLTALIGACIVIGGARAIVVRLTARRAAQQRQG
jgi:uncharacterized membrane protein YeaQ/YmgE (transglycosylase-associated protein family)